MKSVTLLVVATGKYTVFLPKLFKSISDHFLPKCAVQVVVFTDKVYDDGDASFDSLFDASYNFNWDSVLIEHKPWPYATLHRFHFFKEHYQSLGNTDYYFYIDADTLITDTITDEILGERVTVQHCGFMQKRGTYETNPASSSYVYPQEGTHYFGGGFFGFSFVEFWAMVKMCVDMIDMDTRNGIIPIHNDESVLNRYLIDNPPTKILSPSYHYPQSHIEKYKAQWPENYPCKILLLDKNHEEMRSL